MSRLTQEQMEAMAARYGLASATVTSKADTGTTVSQRGGISRMERMRSRPLVAQAYKLGMSIGDVSRHMGIHKSSGHDWLTGRAALPAARVAKLAEVLKVTPEWISSVATIADSEKLTPLSKAIRRAGYKRAAELAAVLTALGPTGQREEDEEIVSVATVNRWSHTTHPVNPRWEGRLCQVLGITLEDLEEWGRLKHPGPSEASRLTELIFRAGFDTSRTFARVVGIPEKSLYQYMVGERGVSLPRFNAMRVALGVSAETLIASGLRLGPNAKRAYGL